MSQTQSNSDPFDLAYLAAQRCSRAASRLVLAAKVYATTANAVASGQPVDEAYLREIQEPIQKAWRDLYGALQDGNATIPPLSNALTCAAKGQVINAGCFVAETNAHEAILTLVQGMYHQVVLRSTPTRDPDGTPDFAVIDTMWYAWLPVFVHYEFDATALLLAAKVEKSVAAQAGLGEGSRITYDNETHTVTWNGRSHIINHPGAFAALTRILDARGQMVAAESLHRLPGCNGRIDMIFKNHLPDALRSIIKSKRGKDGGYWLQIQEKAQMRAIDT
jgi:hypothetical protein